MQYSKKLMLVAFGLLSGRAAFPQLLTNNQVSLTISAGASLTVQGSITNGNNTTIDNSGLLELTGDWQNNSGNNCFGNSQGTVLMDGGTQTIGGTSPTLFNNLTFLGAAPKILGESELVGGDSNTSGILRVNDSYLLLQTDTLEITNPAPGAVSRTSGFIESETDPNTGYSFMIWDIGAANAGNTYLFPFGNYSNQTYQPLSYTITAPGAGSQGKMLAATYPTDPFAAVNNRPLPTGITTFDCNGTEDAPKALDRFWILSARDFTAEPNGTLVFAYNEGEWNGGTNNLTESNLKAQQYFAGQWLDPVGSDQPAANTVSASGVTHLGALWALTDLSSPLPVTLLSFDAQATDSFSVRCSWETATELNTDHFSVEKTRDGKTFVPVGTVKAAGNSIRPLHYFLPDAEPWMGTSYYRLITSDIDGKQTYSNLVAVHFSLPWSSAFQLFPNPAHDKLMLMMKGQQANVSLELINSFGQVLWSRVCFSDGSDIPVELAGLPAGAYVLRITLPGAQAPVLRKFIKVN